MLATHEMAFMTECPSSSVPHCGTTAGETGNLLEEHTGIEDSTPGLTGASCSYMTADCTPTGIPDRDMYRGRDYGISSQSTYYNCKKKSGQCFMPFSFKS